MNGASPRAPMMEGQISSSFPSVGSDGNAFAPLPSILPPETRPEAAPIYKEMKHDRSPRGLLVLPRLLWIVGWRKAADARQIIMKSPIDDAQRMRSLLGSQLAYHKIDSVGQAKSVRPCRGAGSVGRKRIPRRSADFRLWVRYCGGARWRKNALHLIFIVRRHHDGTRETVPRLHGARSPVSKSIMGKHRSVIIPGWCPIVHPAAFRVVAP